jgi:hypothetical protein
MPTRALRCWEARGAAVPPDAAWVLRGTTGNPRYTTRAELDALPPFSRRSAASRRRARR